jgi:dihydrofolate reductase
MRKLILKMSVSVDGFVGGPNGEIDWLLKTLDDNAMRWVLDTLWQAGVHIMGSRTFHDMAAYWPYSTEPLADPMNEIPKIVFSKNKSATQGASEQTTTALKDATTMKFEKKKDIPPSILSSWTEARIASGDLKQEITSLKQQPGKDILAHGGAGFAQSLAALDLIDEYRLVTHPVVLGSGLPLFSKLVKPLYLTLVSTTVFSAGTIAHVYRPLR